MLMILVFGGIIVYAVSFYDAGADLGRRAKAHLENLKQERQNYIQEQEDSGQIYVGGYPLNDFVETIQYPSLDFDYSWRVAESFEDPENWIPKEEFEQYEAEGQFGVYRDDFCGARESFTEIIKENEIARKIALNDESISPEDKWKLLTEEEQKAVLGV